MTKTHNERIEDIAYDLSSELTPMSNCGCGGYLPNNNIGIIRTTLLTYGNTRYEEGVKAERERVREWAKEKKRVKVYNLVKHSTPTNMDTITIPADYESAFKLGEDITLEDLCTFLSDNK